MGEWGKGTTFCLGCTVKNLNISEAFSFYIYIYIFFNKPGRSMKVEHCSKVGP